MTGWHIINASGRLSYNDKRRVKPGKYYTALKNGKRARPGTKVRVCYFGMHASPTLLDCSGCFLQVRGRFDSLVRLCYVRVQGDVELLWRRVLGDRAKFAGRRRMVVKWSKPIHKRDVNETRLRELAREMGYEA